MTSFCKVNQMSQRRIILTTICILSLSNFVIPLTAFSKPSPSGKSGQTSKVTYRPFGGRGPARTGAVGGKRGCAIAQQNTKEALYALVPQEGIGRTVSSQPQVWIYSPYQTTQSALNATLVVRQVNENGEDKQIGEETNIVISANHGLSPVQITQPLQDGKTYKWVVTIKCDQDAAANPVVTGLISIAANPKLQQSLKSASPRQQLITYAENGYWYDVLNQLLADGAAKTDRDDFLRSGGLGGTVDKSINRTVSAAKP
jgi:hypothetical protein